MAFRPDEILFSPTGACNLRCRHCGVERSGRVLPVTPAKKFLAGCKKIGINRVGFTGGEPFLAGNFLSDMVKFCVKKGFFFSNIVTNGVWFASNRELSARLEKLFSDGYDGSFILSVDAYHKQDVRKLARFISEVSGIWNRPDIISIAYVTGKDIETEKKLSMLASGIDGRLQGFGAASAIIRSDRSFIKLIRICLSPVGKAGLIGRQWNGKWFREDHCEGPGNLFLIEPTGAVKPCCGYASGLEDLTIGNIFSDSPEEIVKNIRQNIIVYAIFNQGLSALRKKLESSGVIFPGKTSSHCFFCEYVLREVPRKKLLKCLGG